MAEQYKHFFITGFVSSERYKQPAKPNKPLKIPDRDRETHSTKLLLQFQQIWREKENVISSRTAESIPTREGTYLSFTSDVDSDLITKSLENIKKGIRILNIKEEKVDDEKKQIRATVYVPNGMEGYFVKKIKNYKNENTKTGKPKNASLVNSIEDVSIALLEGLWTDKKQIMPEQEKVWCEAWLNIGFESNVIENQIIKLEETLNNIGITFKSNRIIFPERAVILINANKQQLLELMLQSDLLAEFRAGQETSGFWMNETSIEQQEWVEELLSRLEIVDETKVKVCLLDTGVNNGHQLLLPILENDDTLTVDSAWGTNDHAPRAGHGTLMAGLAGYGNLEKELSSNSRVQITHKLCSVKILPPPTQQQTDKELWGDITSQGISLAEIQNPESLLIHCMAVTSKDDTDRGRPSSWSGSIDNLAFGEGENQRLIIISAGNIGEEELWENYPNSNFVSSIENPAQSWNALTIGAHTEKICVNDAMFNNYIPLAQEGELSPYSTTSLIWEKKWPVKPDVVFEGGNLLKAPDNSLTSHFDLELLSTSKSFRIKQFETINATSAAAAKAAWFAAKIGFLYPDAWPETIRGLIVHSASWSSAMLNQMNVNTGRKREYGNMMKVFGYGIPDLNKALYSYESAFTFIAQEAIQPFSYKIKDGKITSDVETNEIHYYNLPWPTDLLLSMQDISVKLKITLSYFIEPGAGEIGWKDKYRYQSFGLRFDLNNVGENDADFRKRINIAARDEDDENEKRKSGSERWKIGSDNRSNGSIQSDIWEGTAAELATCNLIAVYPIIGWWRERKHLKKVETKARYSLIISLETPYQEIELYTTVKNLIETPIEIRTI